MNKPFTVAVMFALLCLSCLTGRAQFVVTVHGSRTFTKSVNGKQVITSQAVNNASICGEFGVTTKDYAVVFDTGPAILEVISRKAGGATFAVLGLHFAYSTYDADSPEKLEEFGPLASETDANTTDFGGISGVITMKISYRQGSGEKGVSGTVSGAGTMNAPHSLYTISFSGTKPLVQTP